MNNKYEHEFFTFSRYREFWDMVAGLVKLASPMVLISIAMTCVGLVLVLAIRAFRKGAGDDRDDRDYDIKYYD